jgi:DNA-binding transcriptional LysR family regulator
MLDLYKLQVFAQVALAGSFSAAAEQLYLSQPAVSQHIQELEVALGVKLFVRGRRGVTLTAEGNTLKDYAQRILSLVAEAETTVTNVANLSSGQVNIGATPGVGAYLLPQWIHDFRERYSGLTVTMQTGTTPNIAAQLAARQLDLGFVEGELDAAAEAQLASQVLCDVPQLVVVGPKHPLWACPSATLSQLHGQTFIMRQPNSYSRLWLNRIFSAHGIQPKVVAEFDSPEAIKHSVAMDAAIGVLPLYAVRAELQRKSLHAIAMDVPMSRPLSAIWSKATPLAPIARAFMAFADKCAHDAGI